MKSYWTKHECIVNYSKRPNRQIWSDFSKLFIIYKILLDIKKIKIFFYIRRKEVKRKSKSCDRGERLLHTVNTYDLGIRYYRM